MATPSSSSSRDRWSRWWMAGIVVVAAWCVPGAVAGGSGMGRSLLGFTFTEAQGNVTFQCSPAGPCIRCQYSEKNDGKYRCSETGYRIPLKCMEIQDNSKEAAKKTPRKLSSLKNINEVGSHSNELGPRIAFSIGKHFKWRRLLDVKATSETGKQSYITYRSCLPAESESEEKLSVFHFEVIMVCLLLISAPVAYFRQKRSMTTTGFGFSRIPNNSARS